MIVKIREPNTSFSGRNLFDLRLHLATSLREWHINQKYSRPTQKENNTVQVCLINIVPESSLFASFYNQRRPVFCSMKKLLKRENFEMAYFFPYNNNTQVNVWL